MIVHGSCTLQYAQILHGMIFGGQFFRGRQDAQVSKMGASHWSLLWGGSQGPDAKGAEFVDNRRPVSPFGRIHR